MPYSRYYADIFLGALRKTKEIKFVTASPTSSAFKCRSIRYAVFTFVLKRLKETEPSTLASDLSADLPRDSRQSAPCHLSTQYFLKSSAINTLADLLNPAEFHITAPSVVLLPFSAGTQRVSLRSLKNIPGSSFSIQSNSLKYVSILCNSLVLCLCNDAVGYYTECTAYNVRVTGMVYLK